MVWNYTNIKPYRIQVSSYGGLKKTPDSTPNLDDGRRRGHHELIDWPAVKLLLSIPHEYAEWKKARVNINHHNEMEGHYNSSPYQLIKEQ